MRVLNCERLSSKVHRRILTGIVTSPKSTKFFKEWTSNTTKRTKTVSRTCNDGGRTNNEVIRLTEKPKNDSKKGRTGKVDKREL